MRATAYDVMTTCAPSMVSSSPCLALARVRSTTTVRSPGAKRAASLCHVESTEVGATTSTGSSSSPRSWARTIIASICRVLPSPMSSASTPPSPVSQSSDSHRNPSTW